VPCAENKQRAVVRQFAQKQIEAHASSKLDALKAPGEVHHEQRSSIQYFRVGGRSGATDRSRDFGVQSIAGADRRAERPHAPRYPDDVC
jgi:hypothetical protein